MAKIESHEERIESKVVVKRKVFVNDFGIS